ncbi:MAG TPA: DUF4292 domain-containing protein [Cyclobacteriaceae bacterium]|nr:DUF4292 domain-containing protein [Cyclobacteriaceae bacterium]
MNNGLRLALLLSVLISAGCSKKIAPPSGGKPVVNIVPNDSLSIEEINFDYLHGKARMVLKDGTKENEVKANIRVRKDSVIWMNFTVIGVQGGRVLINRDSITLLNNVKNEYFVFDYKELSRKFNVEINYDVIQSAMLGNLLLPRTPQDTVERKAASYLLNQQSGTIDVLNYISATTMKIQKVELKEHNTHNSLVINYGNFQPLDTKRFPYDGTISLFYKAPAGLLNTTIIFEYNKVEVGDKELRFPFNIPRKYDRR